MKKKSTDSLITNTEGLKAMQSKPQTKKDLGGRFARVVRQTWILFKATDLTFDESMKQAYFLHELAKMMRRGIVNFKYKKVDGEIRTARGVMSGEMGEGVFRYFDVDKQAWRSFKIENFIGVVK